MQLSRVNSPAGQHRTQRPQRSAKPAADQFRPDIQGLRALAIVLVLVYHLYPHLLTGGYVGVDVFFVISGFLITGHLAGRYAKTGRVRLLEFYGRRARRLLPAAVLVLVVTWFVGRQVLPTTQLPAAATQIRASALYVQNWVLAGNAVDYLKANEAATPVEHYWSLSVEEQFYLIWPLLFVAAWLVAARLLRHRHATEQATAAARRIGLAVATLLAAGIVGGSLWYSITETATHPQSAYFITTTRLWELGIGGLLALVHKPVRRRIGRFGLASWIGLGMIVYSAVTLSGSSAFPGSVALLSTCGAALMIASGAPGSRLGTAGIFARRPAVFLGDISYSLYLWHWPIIVLWKAYSGGSIGVLDGPAIAVLAVAAAWLTKVLVEDPIRLAPFVARYPSRSLATSLTAAVPVVLATLFLANQPAPFHGGPDQKHPGAAALADMARAPAVTSSAPGTAPSTSAPPSTPAAPSPPPSKASIIPPLPQAPRDAAFANMPDCKAGTFSTELVTCRRGDTSSPRLTVALIGDSFAAEWSSALAKIAKAQHWQLVTLVHDGCPWTATTLVRAGTTTPYIECKTWGKKALNYLVNTLHPDVTFVSFHPALGVASHPAYDTVSEAQITKGMISYWRKLSAAGIFVVGIDHSPDPGMDVPSCLSSRTGSVKKCTVARKDAGTDDATIKKAVAALGPDHAANIDMTSYICTPTVCPPVVGNVIVYRDEKHLTETFTLSLVPYLEQKLMQVPALQKPPEVIRGPH